MARIRVLVVEDSLTVRKRLVEILAADPEIEVVGEAEDGKRAIELCQEARPDVITMDMMLPVMTGLAATEYIMAHCPTPILIVSSSINRGELFRTYDALAAGAVDVLEKPTGDEPDGVWEREFISTVKLVSRIRVITHPRARLGASASRALGRRRRDHRESRARPVPDARSSPSARRPAGPAPSSRSCAPAATFRLPILLVLHINEPFGAAFADWLDGQTARRVAYRQGRRPVAAAGGTRRHGAAGRHLVVRDGRLRLTLDPGAAFLPPLGRRAVRVGRARSTARSAAAAC